MPIIDMPARPARRAAGCAVSVAALLVVAYVATAGQREDTGEVPPEAAAWYGAMSLYRTIAVWAGRRALSAEMSYWKAVS